MSRATLALCLLISVAVGQPEEMTRKLHEQIEANRKKAKKKAASY